MPELGRNISFSFKESKGAQDASEDRGRTLEELLTAVTDTESPNPGLVPKKFLPKKIRDDMREYVKHEIDQADRKSVV